jgi:hypothetical protein
MTVEQEKCSVFWRGRVGESLPGRVLIDFFTTESQRHRETNCLEKPSLMVLTVQGFLCGSVTLW